jgi:cardiolipin synthase
MQESQGLCAAMRWPGCCDIAGRFYTRLYPQAAWKSSHLALCDGLRYNSAQGAVSEKGKDAGAFWQTGDEPCRKPPRRWIRQDRGMSRHLTLAGPGIALALLALLIAGRAGGQIAAPRVAPLAIVINEVAWGGTAASTSDEWIELYNNTAMPIDLTNWTLKDGGDINLTLHGAIPAHGYFLLERTADDTVSNIPADIIYTGSLSNSGERVELRDGAGALVDSADGTGGWPGGSGTPGYYSMERLVSTDPDVRSNWASHNGSIRNGLDADSNPINGTPRARNSVASSRAELWIRKSGPDSIQPDHEITYTLAFGNYGNCAAAQVWITDQLPVGVSYVRHTAPYSPSLVGDATWVLDVGSVPAASGVIRFTVTGLVEAGASGPLVNVVTATTTSSETTPADNYDSVETLVSSQSAKPAVLIEALYYDGYALYDADEAIRVMNVSTTTAPIGGWSVAKQASPARAIFPAGTTLAPGQAIWCTRKATAFEQQFGFKPVFETDDTDPAVAEMDGSWPAFANDGSVCLLQDASGTTVDVLVYESGDTEVEGWNGPAVQPWAPSNTFGAEGQILYRKRDQRTGLPTASGIDGEGPSAAYWAQDPGDHIDGRKVQYPGWDLDQFFWTAQVTDTAVLTVAVGPDHLLETIQRQIEKAEESIWIEGYTFESAALAHTITESLGSGVSVTMLLEGGPSGGIEEAQRWLCDQVRQAGGQVYFLYNDPVHSRYRFQHAKFMLIDDRLALIGSENLNPSSMPADNKGDGTAGRRGVYLITDAPGVVDRVRAVLHADLDPAHHEDIVTCADVPILCTGSPPPSEPNWTSYTIAFSQPLTIQGDFAFEVIQAPENSLRTVDGLLGLIGQAGDGDTILIEQFYERVHWGASDGTPETDPNPRLDAYLAAARRGATVRILLDRYFDLAGENAATVAYLQAVARTEGLDVEARLGDPTHLGLHNKMMLASIGGQGYVHAGSLNGGESSAKINRELALQVQSNEAYDYLKAVFDYDWRLSAPALLLPLVIKEFEFLQPADHLLVSEVYYAVDKEHEWVEIVNPTDAVVDLAAYKIGDAQSKGVFEGMYRLPAGTSLQPGQVRVIASSAAAFRLDNPGRTVDFEFYETDPAVPTLQPYPQWGTGEWHLRNEGDEVILLDGSDRAVDVVVYGDKSYPGVIPHPGVSLFTHSLERFPYMFDTDDCSRDFRDWPFPNPGELPAEQGQLPASIEALLGARP